MADAHEESSEDFSDSTSSDNFSIYTEFSSSVEDLQNVEVIKSPGRLLHRRQRIIHVKGNRNHLRNSRL